MALSQWLNTVHVGVELMARQEHGFKSLSSQVILAHDHQCACCEINYLKKKECSAEFT